MTFHYSRALWRHSHQAITSHQDRVKWAVSHPDKDKGYLITDLLMRIKRAREIAAFNSSHHRSAAAETKQVRKTTVTKTKHKSKSTALAQTTDPTLEQPTQPACAFTFSFSDIVKRTEAKNKKTCTTRLYLGGSKGEPFIVPDTTTCAGVVLFGDDSNSGERYFLLGINHKTQTLCNFGGAVSIIGPFSCLSTKWSDFMNESVRLGISGWRSLLSPTMQLKPETLVVANPTDCLICVKVPLRIEPNLDPTFFQYTHQTPKDQEVCGWEWISGSKLLLMLSNPVNQKSPSNRLLSNPLANLLWGLKAESFAC